MKKCSKSVITISLQLSMIICAVSLRAQQNDSSDSSGLKPPAVLTAEEDHQRLMTLLGIDSLRPGPSGNPDAPNAANTDESKATPYTSLPDPLVMNNGDPVTDSETWRQMRRQEIMEAFDSEVYGRVPRNTPSVHWELIQSKKDTIGDIPAVIKELSGHVDHAFYPPVTVDIQMTLITPADAAGPVPAIMEFGFDFSKFPNLPPGIHAWKEKVLSKGWACAILIPTSIQEDNGAGLTRGIIGLCNRGQPRETDDWGALRAWAWGASRALDYLETDSTVDAAKVGIEGLSRYGKAALVTMAYDQRFAVAFVGSSGAAGAKLHRRILGEQVENVASSYEYHWMAGNYIKYAGPLTPNDLPVDSHELIALCAPRPVFVGVGSPEVEGQWVDAKGMFLALVYAGPVYRLLGKKDLGATQMPPIGTTLTDGDLAFRQHQGGHTNGPNWPFFLQFADRYFTNDNKAGRAGENHDH